MIGINRTISELEKLKKRCISMHDSLEKSIQQIKIDNPTATTPVNESLYEVEKAHILTVYAQTYRSCTKSASILNNSRTSLWRKLKDYGIIDE